MEFNKLSKAGLKSGYNPLIWIQTEELERGMSYVLNSLSDAGQNLEDFLLMLHSGILKLRKCISVHNDIHMALSILKISSK